MPFIKSLCPTCNKPAEASREFIIGDKTVCSLKCGHLLEKEHLNRSLPEQIVSMDGKHLYKFQCDGVRFVEASGARCLIADEMGLGKTVQSLGSIILHPELQPVLWIGKASLKRQYQYEMMRWAGEDFFAQVIDSPNDMILPGLPAYIMSYDIISRFAKAEEKKNKKKKKDERLKFDTSYYDELMQSSETFESSLSKQKGVIEELAKRLKIKTIILDECQQIKNHESQRAIFVRELCKHVEHIIALSGTPIKNNSAEYFSILNILKPELYPRYSTFLKQECDSYFNGYSFKTGGLKDADRFLEKTKGFILRRERAEVLPDLPPIVRNFQFCELSEIVEKEYLKTFESFRDEYNSVEDMASFERQSNILAFLSKMRHLVGISKIDPCIDHVMEILGSTQDRVTIFTHHTDVAEILVMKLNSLLKELNLPECARHQAGSQSMETERAFEQARVLVCSTLAGGEGLNLQKLCHRFIMLERQWNPANEEQAEARFPRPEGLKVDSIDGTYFVAVGTVDEFFSELVEKKRSIVAATLDNRTIEWDQTSLMKELTEVLANKGGRRWQI